MRAISRSGRWALFALAAGCSSSGGGKALDLGDAAVATVDIAPDVAACDGQCTVAFASGPDWSVYDDDPASNPGAHRLGPAQPVCLNAGAPPNCPNGAVVYGFGGNGWSMSLLMIPDALWVWGPVAPSDPADLKRFFFVRSFTLGDRPGGRISVAADDAAEVRINGRVLDTVGSVTDVAEASISNSRLTTFDLTPLLVTGPNTITIAAQNGPASFAGCPSSCAYSGNPAGVVFGGSITYH